MFAKSEVIRSQSLLSQFLFTLFDQCACHSLWLFSLLWHTLLSGPGPRPSEEPDTGPLEKTYPIPKLTA